MGTNPFRALPSVNDVLDIPIVQSLLREHARALVVQAVREELAALRGCLAQGDGTNGEADRSEIAGRVAQRVEREQRPRLRTVINATGIVLHTNLGRAPLAEEAARAAYEAAHGYLNLELDLETGKRSSRQAAIREWIKRLTGAEAATAVNNNAAATVLTLRALCREREVVISRGQLIEIGGSFRIPEIMAVSGAVLREVGTTNITRLSDYENAIGPDTAALMQVHTSNYRISGFTHSVPLEDLADLGKRRGLLVIDDIGSGAIFDFGRFGLQGEPMARASLAAGADLVLFSGDKLLGGPQCGIIAGRMELIAAVEKDPLMRAFRLDKMSLAALEATLRLYLHEERALRELPVLRMLGTPLEELRGRAEALAARCREIAPQVSLGVREDVAYVGGGSLPDQALKTWVVEIEAPGISETELAQRLRTGTPAVMARLREGKLVLDLRTIFQSQEADLLHALGRAVLMDDSLPTD